MDLVTRRYRPDDAATVVELSIHAWAPVFGSIREMLGDELFERLHGESWVRYQTTAVQGVLDDDQMHIWVAEVDRVVVAFVAVRILDGGEVGEIYMLAVDPHAQLRGIGTELTLLATKWIEDAGIPVALIETGGDPGHGPARRTYEKAGYTALPAVRFFKAF